MGWTVDSGAVDCGQSRISLWLINIEYRILNIEYRREESRGRRQWMVDCKNVLEWLIGVISCHG